MVEYLINNFEMQLKLKVFFLILMLLEKLWRIVRETGGIGNFGGEWVH